MAFPKTALLAGVAASLTTMAVVGWGVLFSLGVGVLVFMLTGGLQYARMVAKYLPRDYW